MGRNGLRPHVVHLLRILDGQATRFQVEETLYRYVNDYLVPLEAAKRAVVVRLGGEAQALHTQRSGWNYQSVLCQYDATVRT